MAMASTPSSLRILVVGSAMGSITTLFDKMSTIHEKHGPFNFALCIGDFFGSPGVNDGGNTEKLLAGQLRAPLPCYIMQGEHPIPEIVIEQFSKTNGELCDNVFLLSKSAVITTAEGLRIACLGGTYKPEIYDGSEIPHGFSSPYYTSRTVLKLLSNTVSSLAPKAPLRSSLVSALSSSPLVDVFISHGWPSAITEFSSVPLLSSELPDAGSPPIDEIIEKSKPRYIFSSGGGKSPVFWEREPFTWADETNRVSRFVGLGAFGGEPISGKKQRWFYAFTITPQVQMKEDSSRPANATPNPFTNRPRTDKRTFEAVEDQIGWDKRPKRSHTGKERDRPPSGYRCKRCDSTDHYINTCPERAIPPENYICRACHNHGHFVRDCPTQHAVGDTGGRKPREGYVCRACGSELHYIKDCPIVQERRTPDGRMSGRRASTREVGPDECWFCLSNPALSKHLIVTIGEECYLTLPKGKLVPTRNPERYRDAEISNVPGGGHVLIVPIAHCMTLDTISSELRTSVLDECDRYQAALRALYAKYDATAVFFETGRISAKGGHAHIQAVPVPLSLQDRVETAFQDASKLHGIEFTVEEDHTSGNEERDSYFRVELPNGRRLVYRNNGGLPFSVQFGRNVVASLLKMDERADWKTCLQSDEDDKADVLAFKTAFSPFDPSK